MRGFEMVRPASDFIVFDDDEASNEQIEGEVVEDEV